MKNLLSFYIIASITVFCLSGASGEAPVVLGVTVD